MPLHDGSHFAITRKPWVWRALGATHDFLNGSSYLVWLYQHMLGHHAYTNIDGADPDIETGARCLVWGSGLNRGRSSPHFAR